VIFFPLAAFHEVSPATCFFGSSPFRCWFLGDYFYFRVTLRLFLPFASFVPANSDSALSQFCDPPAIVLEQSRYCAEEEVRLLSALLTPALKFPLFLALRIGVIYYPTGLTDD